MTVFVLCMSEQRITDDHQHPYLFSTTRCSALFFVDAAYFGIVVFRQLMDRQDMIQMH